MLAVSPPAKSILCICSQTFGKSKSNPIDNACRIAIALLAQFYPKKYPDNWLILLLCLVFYGVGSAALSVFTSLAEEDSFLITKPKKVSSV